MANITVSNDIDTFLQAANNAAAKSALGINELANWEEDGTTLQPTVAGYALGSESNKVGNINSNGYLSVGNITSSLSVLSWQNRVGFVYNGGIISGAIANFIGFSNSNTATTSGRYGFSRNYSDDAIMLWNRSSPTSPTSLQIYNTYTDASNYERGFLKWDTNEFVIGAEALGTGTKRSVRIEVGSTFQVGHSSGQSGYLLKIVNGAGNSSAAFGVGAVASGYNGSLAVGQGAICYGYAGMTIGQGGVSNGSGANAIGGYSNATHTFASAIGYQSQTVLVRSATLTSDATPYGAPCRGFVAAFSRGAVTTDGATTAIYPYTTGYLQHANKGFVLPTNCAVTITGTMIAKRTDASNESAMWEIKLCADDNGGTTALVGTPIITTLGDDSGGTWLVDISTGTSEVIVTVTGESSKTIEWSFCGLFHILDHT